MVKVALKEYFKGNISPRLLRMNLILTIAIYGTLIVMAVAVFPGGYNLAKYTISSLGNPYKNAFPGWFYFSIASWALAIMLVPFFRFIHRRLKKYSPRFARGYLFFSIIVALGLILLGIFPEINQTLIFHGIAMLMCFGGFLIAANFSWLCLYYLGKAAGRKNGKFVNVSLAIMITSFWGSIIMAAIALGFKTIGIFQGTILSNIFIWEWFVFFSVGIYIMLLEVIISREKE